MNELKAIIFDMDGTLADTEDIHRRAFNQAFSEYGYNWQWSIKEYIHLLQISGGKERIYDYLRHKNVQFRDNGELWQHAKAIHQRKSEIYRDKLIHEKIELRPGVARLINEASDEKIILSIATSSSRRNVETLLNNAMGADALTLFSTIVTCDIIEHKKPSPAVFQYVLSELKLKPSECITIEDTCNGNLSALRAGLKTVVTTHDFTIDDDFTGASLVVDQLGEPGHAFVVKSGNAFGSQLVDIALLRRILATETNRLKEASIV